MHTPAQTENFHPENLTAQQRSPEQVCDSGFPAEGILGAERLHHGVRSVEAVLLEAAQSIDERLVGPFLSGMVGEIVRCSGVIETGKATLYISYLESHTRAIPAAEEAETISVSTTSTASGSACITY